MMITDVTYILNVELEILGITERSLQGLNRESLTSFIGETHEEPHNFIGWKLWTEQRHKTTMFTFKLPL